MNDIREMLAAALLNTVMDAHVGTDADGLLTIDPAIVQEAFAIALATMLEADPRLTTPKSIREASEKVGQQVRLYVRAFRERYQETGTRIWNAHAVTRQ